MNDEVYRVVMSQIDLLNYAVEQLRTGIHLAHELENSGRIQPHDAGSHIDDFIKSAHAKIDEIAAVCRLALKYEEQAK